MIRELQLEMILQFIESLHCHSISPLEQKLCFSTWGRGTSFGLARSESDPHESDWYNVLKPRSAPRAIYTREPKGKKNTFFWNPFMQGIHTQLVRTSAYVMYRSNHSRRYVLTAHPGICCMLQLPALAGNLPT